MRVLSSHASQQNAAAPHARRGGGRLRVTPNSSDTPCANPYLSLLSRFDLALSRSTCLLVVNALGVRPAQDAPSTNPVIGHARLHTCAGREAIASQSPTPWARAGDEAE